jgi:uncharacterized cupredoxin-like copper-binding protein
MKRRIPLFAAVLLMFAIAACGSLAPVSTQAPAQPEATEPDPAIGGTQVEIALADNTIDASMTSFQVGVPYTFVITNAGQHAHNFNINPPVSVTGSLEGSFNSALLAVPQEQLGPGQTATVEFTFPEEAAGQLLEFSCLIRRHYDDGMKMDIVVTQ